MKCASQQAAVSRLQNERSQIIENLRFATGDYRASLERQLNDVERRLGEAEDALTQCMESQD